ncbi:MAG: TIGR02647 family protein [Spongiibacter sp.]|uniref:TIGR02647 family protein n=1 Tax=Spongiibacter thalassae TaxID=2721624 RepID=A0ABX1GBH0_9GAMM|nr:TIGR02647 family protein [Spongiibacter thalassae]MDX1504899.1 TIGR02647 family protein [Spongiibacter sp.]NKI16286.1 TIGR02647 family protein [Spongiibacter thalassae]
MSLSDHIIQEIRVLAQFNPASVLEGIKVHHDADPEMIAATERLFDKGIITQLDGGYLTDAGIELIKHLDTLQTVLMSPTAKIVH